MGLLEFLIVTILLMWLLGAFVVPFAGSLIHLLLVLLVVVILVRLIQGRPVA